MGLVRPKAGKSAKNKKETTKNCFKLFFDIQINLAFLKNAPKKPNTSEILKLFRGSLRFEIV